MNGNDPEESMLERKSVLTKVATETEGGALESAEANKMAMLLYFALLFDLAVLSMKVCIAVFCMEINCWSISPMQALRI